MLFRPVGVFALNVIVWGTLLLAPFASATPVQRKLTHTYFNGVNPVCTSLIERPSGIDGYILWEGPGMLTLHFSAPQRLFDRLWNGLMNSGATKYKPKHGIANEKKNYVFGTGTSAMGAVVDYFEVPKTEASPAVVKLDAEFRKLVKMCVSVAPPKGVFP